MRIFAVAILVMASIGTDVCQAEGPPQNGQPAGVATQSRTAAIATPDQPAVADQPVPDHVVYLIYFRHLANLDRVAAECEADGKDGSGWRSHEQRAVGLSEGEGETLKQLAYDCIRAVAETDRQTERALAAFHARHPPRESLLLLQPPEPAQLEKRKIQIVNAHIDQLRSRLGERAFDRLDAHVSKAFKTAVRQVRVPLPVPPATLSGGDR